MTFPASPTRPHLARIIELRRLGHSWREVGAGVGLPGLLCKSAYHNWRRLKALPGVNREKFEARAAEVERRYKAGEPVPRIATAIGVSKATAEHIVRFLIAARRVESRRPGLVIPSAKMVVETMPDLRRPDDVFADALAGRRYEDVDGVRVAVHRFDHPSIWIGATERGSSAALLLEDCGTGIAGHGPRGWRVFRGR